MKKNGFTLVEVLVTIMIIGVIGYMLSDILVRSLNNGRKSEVIGNVKQNAQNTLSKMSMVMRGADIVTCNSGTIIALLNKDGSYTRFRFYPPPSASLNGSITQDFPGTAISIPPAASVRLCDGTTYPPEGEISLTDSDPIRGVSVVNGQFSLVQTPGSKDSVTIHLEVCTGAQVQTCVGPQGGSYQNQLLYAVPFDTTVQLR